MENHIRLADLPPNGAHSLPGEVSPNLRYAKCFERAQAKAEQEIRESKRRTRQIPASEAGANQIRF